MQYCGALLPLRPHLLLHRLEDIGRRPNRLDFVAQDFGAPRLRGLVDLGHDIRVDQRTFLEGVVEFDLADLTSERRLRELLDCEGQVRDTIRRAFGVDDLVVQNTVDVDEDVVLRDAVLFGNRNGLLAQVDFGADGVHKGCQDLQAAQ